MDFTRREFLKTIVATGTCAGLLSGDVFRNLNPALLAATVKNKKGTASTDDHIFFEKEAMFYDKLPEKEIKCKLCPKECEIGDQERGWCGVRENRDGIYYSMVYGNPCSINPDPIEKKPFFHFMPGAMAYSIATAGCNMNCKFCQNWEISQSRPEDTRNFRLPPANVIAEAKQFECKTIAPTLILSQPYSMNTCLILQSLQESLGLRSVVVSAGFINPEPLKLLCQNVDAIKIDLKSFRNEFYNKICSAELKPVLNTLKIIKASKVWFEIVYLVVPTLNDTDAELRDTARWINDNLGPDTPIHFSRFAPNYQLKLPPTSVDRLNTARQIAMDAGLRYVYVGNLAGNPGENTYCPKCKREVIKRVYLVRQMNLVNGKCKWCGEKIPGIWA